MRERTGVFVGLGLDLNSTNFTVRWSMLREARKWAPLNLVAHKIGPAIAAGNAVILKPHSSTPLSARKLVELFEDTELPAGVLQLVTGAGAIIGDQLVSDPRVRMVSFTGGPQVGHKILAQAGLKKIGMELGLRNARRQNDFVRRGERLVIAVHDFERHH